MTKRKDKKVEVRMDPELYEQAHRYAEERGVSLGAFIRAVVRRWTNPEDPRSLEGLDIELERKRPSRRKPPEE